MYKDMKSIHCSIIRGGTSKGVYIMENELPKDINERNRVIQAIFGSPDVRQIDGLGGADTLTSKLAIISPSSKDGVDIEYTFAQVGIDQDIVDYSGNCGNISSGVGPFVIDEGIIKAEEPVTKITIYQTNTDKLLRAEVPVKDGKTVYEGDFKIDGVPGTGARITMDFSDTVGAITGKLLPTGNVKDKIEVMGDEYEVTIVDAGNPLVFIKAESLQLKGTETPAEIENKTELMTTIECIRGKAAQKLGLVEDWRHSSRVSPYLPFFAIVSPAASYIGYNGLNVKEKEIDIVSRLLFMLKMHKTYPGTGAVCTGAASRIPGSIPYEVLSARAKNSEIINIGHPSGIMQVESIASKTNEDSIIFKKLAFYRTSRRIMDGKVYIKKSVLNKAEKGVS